MTSLFLERSIGLRVFWHMVYHDSSLSCVRTIPWISLASIWPITSGKYSLHADNSSIVRYAGSKGVPADRDAETQERRQYLERWHLGRDNVEEPHVQDVPAEGCRNDL